MVLGSLVWTLHSAHSAVTFQGGPPTPSPSLIICVLLNFQFAQIINSLSETVIVFYVFRNKFIEANF